MIKGEVAVGTRIGRYVAGGVLGRGGMAEVYRVETASGEAFALKLLHTTLPELEERLRLEGEVQKQLRHPNLVAVFGSLSHEGRLGLLMELVDGPSLEARLGEGSMALEACDALAAGLFAGVAFAHRAGVLHRDLKPANVLLAMGPSGQWVPKVGDFGLVKRMDYPHAGAGTRTGTAMGTPCYMPPEQLRDAKSVDERADVFALGVILYEVVTGARPWESEDLITLYHRMVEGPEHSVRSLRPDVELRMERAIVAALAPDRDARCASVHELAAIWRGELIPKVVSRAPETLEISALDLFDRIDPASDRAHGPRRPGLQAGAVIGGVVLAILVAMLAWKGVESQRVGSVVGPAVVEVAAPVTSGGPIKPQPRPVARPIVSVAPSANEGDVDAPVLVDVSVVPADTDPGSVTPSVREVDRPGDGG